MATYRVKTGRFGARKQYGVGDMVELDPAHAVGFEDKLELVVAPVAEDAPEEAPKAVKAKAKA